MLSQTNKFYKIMKRFFVSLVSIFLVFSFSSQNLFAADSSASSKYDDINFPQWTLDLRRTEIITFGSLPFVMIWTTVGYSLYEYGEFKNPLSKDTSSFDEEDIKKIIGISALASIGLGLTDLSINLINRARKESRLRKLRESQPFTIMRESEMQKIRLKEGETDEQALERMRHENEIESMPMPEDFIEGVESALF